MSFDPREKTAQEHVDGGTFNPAIYLDLNGDLRGVYQTSNPYTAGDLANATAHFLAHGYGEKHRPVFPAGHVYEFGQPCTFSTVITNQGQVGPSILVQCEASYAGMEPKVIKVYGGTGVPEVGAVIGIEVQTTEQYGTSTELAARNAELAAAGMSAASSVAHVRSTVYLHSNIDSWDTYGAHRRNGPLSSLTNNNPNFDMRVLDPATTEVGSDFIYPLWRKQANELPAYVSDYGTTSGPVSNAGTYLVNQRNAATSHLVGFTAPDGSAFNGGITIGHFDEVLSILLGTHPDHPPNDLDSGGCWTSYIRWQNYSYGGNFNVVRSSEWDWAAPSLVIDGVPMTMAQLNMGSSIFPEEDVVFWMAYGNQTFHVTTYAMYNPVVETIFGPIGGEEDRPMALGERWTDNPPSEGIITEPWFKNFWGGAQGVSHPTQIHLIYRSS